MPQKYEKKLEKLTYVCPTCKRHFTPNSKPQIYCPNCRKKDKYCNIIRTWTDVKKRGGFIGTLSELKIAVDLMSKGFEVYRNISSHGSVDLIVYREDGVIIPIEVTTGSVNKSNNKHYFDKHNKHIKRIDIIAVCYYDGIRYYETDGNVCEKEVDIEKWIKP